MTAKEAKQILSENGFVDTTEAANICGVTSGGSFINQMISADITHVLIYGKHDQTRRMVMFSRDEMVEYANSKKAEKKKRETNEKQQQLQFEEGDFNRDKILSEIYRLANMLNQKEA